MRIGLPAVLALALVPSLSLAGSPPSLVTDEVIVESADGVAVAVHHAARRDGCRKQPVLLVHGTWGSAQTWDFPDRSVMDRLARRGYDTYAVDLRGMGDSPVDGTLWAVGLPERMLDVLAAATHVRAVTGRAPVIIGWSQGGMVTAMAVAHFPGIAAGVAFLGVPGNGIYLDPALVPVLQEVATSGLDRWLPPPDLLYAIVFGWDPITGKPTMSAEAFAEFYAMSRADSVLSLLQMASPDFYTAVVTPSFAQITVPALVADGALDAFVGADRARDLYDLLGSTDKELVVFPRNAHGFFLEDNYAATQRVFDEFLDRFDGDGDDSDCLDDCDGAESDGE